ncbi:uncharacterized protein B0H18DRAFT_96796 [Fomitopsis serialis]|uniref:uncharacterized protein n=1 Tax=Fomitopsis serialis TaxID=139415 RepID=UPI0020079429|nr:uncharacterized protein B0H18DRAFT_96796 [Neoantrodia serialis]KAH9915393.1 hypothetical protein B0H18DRAFT_96796 [Neoantrodia serialis]
MQPRPFGSRTLPLELCEAIIDLCREDPSTLRACSRVSRAWFPASRKHIFSSIRFAEGEDITTFQALLSSELPGSSSIPSLVRDLCLGGNMPRCLGMRTGRCWLTPGCPACSSSSLQWRRYGWRISIGRSPLFPP